MFVYPEGENNYLVEYAEEEMITVIGAGLGGLTLAAVLHRRGVEVAVYDLDASATSRHQGGMLDIHDDSGQAALRAAGLHDGFRAAYLEGADGLRVLDKSGTVLWTDEGGGDRPEIDRGALRDLLLSALPDGMVRWGARMTGVRAVAGGYEVTFADGATVTTDLLVGADGAWSKVRPLVSGAQPAYAGISFVEARIEDSKDSHPRSAATVGSGLMFALDDEKGMIAHLEPHSELCVYAALKTTEDWIRTTEITRAAVLANFADWDDDLRGLITDSTGDLIPRALYSLPVGHRWDRVPGVTLIGDAAHLMSPFAGEGANLAMQDGAELATAIADHPGDIEAALTAYESAMFPRAAAAAEASAGSMDQCFAPHGAKNLTAMFQSFQPQPEPRP
jgi:2-polyprenyl-6-methoxyphenol hydroxylase-like FAD-dependent oxidoreductase